MPLQPNEPHLSCLVPPHHPDEKLSTWIYATYIQLIQST